MKRGADVNIEDKNGCLPDDIPASNREMDDCQEVIAVHRKQRNQQLSQMVREVRPSKEIPMFKVT